MKNNAIKTAYRMFMYHVGVSILWMLMSLLTLLILTGAATASAFALTLKIQTDEEPVHLMKDFMMGIKKNLAPATLIFIPSMLLYITLFFIWNYAFNTGETILVFTTILSALYLTVFNLHVYPLMSIFKHGTMRGLLKNTILFMHIHPFLTIKLIGTLALFILIIFFIHPLMFIPGLSLYFLIFTFHLRGVYQRYIDQLKEAETHV